MNVVVATYCHMYLHFKLKCSSKLNTLAKRFNNGLFYDVASGSEITQRIKIDKPLVVYRFSGNVK